MADSEPVDTTQQVTSKAPTTKQKNPKQAREAQKKALAEVILSFAPKVEC